LDITRNHAAENRQQSIMTYARERELISQGQDEVIAEVTRSIFEKTTAGKAIMERVNGLSDEEVDAGLRGLEPK
jgi:hypothetical protein